MFPHLKSQIMRSFALAILCLAFTSALESASEQGRMLAKLKKLVTVGTIPEVDIAFVTESVDINPEQYFTNQTSPTFTLTMATSTTMPGWFVSFVNGVITLRLRYSDAGTYQMLVTATDSSGEVAQQPLTIRVRGCDSKCTKCFDIYSNTCYGCSSNNFLKWMECIDNGTECGEGYYGNTTTSRCTSCPSACALCQGGDVNSQCSKCASNYYLHQGGCKDRCPAGYIENSASNTCDKINSTTAKYMSCLKMVAELYAANLTTQNSEVSQFADMQGRDF